MIKYHYQRHGKYAGRSTDALQESLLQGISGVLRCDAFLETDDLSIIEACFIGDTGIKIRILRKERYQWESNNN